jgi:SpoVK/Ycf46/Vps4 family AAA+-type ATPase
MISYNPILKKGALMDKEEKKVRLMNLTPKAIFGSRFEEKKAHEYLLNLINSPYLHNDPFCLFQFADDVLGQNKTIPSLLKLCSPEQQNRILNNNTSHTADYVPCQTIIHLLRDVFAPLLRKRLNRLYGLPKTETEKRLLILQETFNLSNCELEIITFLHVIEMDIFKAYFSSRVGLFDLTELPNFRSAAHQVLGLKRYDIAKALTEGNLFKSSMIEMNYGKDISLADWCDRYLSGAGDKKLSHDFFSDKNDIALNIANFDVPEEELKVLNTLMKSPSGHNILFYGESGTGKTSLAKCLAKTYGKELLTVKVPITDKHKDRLHAIYGTINLAQKDHSIILIDEADEVLNTSSFFFQSQTNKSWINTFLEDHQQKIIWICNRFHEIHPSTMRRFSFCMEFQPFNAKKRMKVLTNEIRQKGFMHYFSEKDIQEISMNYAINAGSIVNALDILAIDKTTDKETVLQKMKTILKSHEKVTSGKRYASSQKAKDFSGYSLKGLNCSEDPETIIVIMKKYAEQQESGTIQINRPMSLLLYGLPGTGKSEFVYYLGHVLEKEVVLRRCSDIHSMWVGETEKNIANAFREAQENNRVLFFDEADSFLFPRKDALRSWEKNFTNEILTQLESYMGVVVFATNEIEGLDHASLRRFRFKIEFRPLTPEGNLHFYNTFLKPLVPSNYNLTDKEKRMVKSLNNLTPGDFGVVKDRYLFADSSAITHQILIALLIDEIRYKKGIWKKIGFYSP